MWVDALRHNEECNANKNTNGDGYLGVLGVLGVHSPDVDVGSNILTPGEFSPIPR